MAEQSDSDQGDNGVVCGFGLFVAFIVVLVVIAFFMPPHQPSASQTLTNATSAAAAQVPLITYGVGSNGTFLQLLTGVQSPTYANVICVIAVPVSNTSQVYAPDVARLVVIGPSNNNANATVTFVRANATAIKYLFMIMVGPNVTYNFTLIANGEPQYPPSFELKPGTYRVGFEWIPEPNLSRSTVVEAVGVVISTGKCNNNCWFLAP